MKILYIEDSPDQIPTVERIAHYMGHELITALTGEHGMARFAEQPDLVLIDIHLPNFNGLDVVRQMRNKQHLMPIIAVTGDVWNYSEQHAIEAGCNGFLEKPYTVEAIRDLFSHYCV
jgi:two-component system cell cycle response regulator DivK